jgi:CheY-like chemotaxis protein/HPt (histidine-containing phosphotransfer) domain-containing protein
MKETDAPDQSDHKITESDCLSNNNTLPNDRYKRFRNCKGVPNQCGKLLMAEDNSINEEVVVDMLVQLGYEVDVVVNGAEVLFAVESSEYSVILMDCNMPVMDGFEATRKLRERESILGLVQTPVIALTAYGATGAREKCLSSGMNDYLCKPVGITDIRLMLEKWDFKRKRELIDIYPAVASKPVLYRDDHECIQKGVQTYDAHNFRCILDTSKLDMLRIRKQQRNKGLVKKVINLYLEQTPKLLDTLNASFLSGDYESVMHMAHTLKSSSMTIGAEKFAGVCHEIENSSRIGQVDEDSVSCANQAFIEVEQALQITLSKESCISRPQGSSC